MSTKQTYQILLAKMYEVSELPTQKVGPFTYIYKTLVPYFKFSPWRSATLLASLASILLYFLFGTAVVKLVSLLQFGF